jgi:hypothetical protein
MKNLSTLRNFRLALVLTCVGACVRHASSAGAAPDDARARVAARSERIDERLSTAANFLGSAQLYSVNGTSVADAVSLLRPKWLQPRQPINRRAPMSRPEWIWPSVYINGRYAGGPDELIAIPLRRAAEVRFLSPVAGAAQFGERCPCSAGVIHVLWRSP